MMMKMMWMVVMWLPMLLTWVLLLMMMMMMDARCVRVGWTLIPVALCAVGTAHAPGRLFPLPVRHDGVWTGDGTVIVGAAPQTLTAVPPLLYHRRGHTWDGRWLARWPIAEPTATTTTTTTTVEATADTALVTVEHVRTTTITGATMTRRLLLLLLWRSQCHGVEHRSGDHLLNVRRILHLTNRRCCWSTMRVRRRRR